MDFKNNINFAKELDQADPLHSFREKFHFPLKEDGSKKVYFTGNSLGLQPKDALKAIQTELEDWATHG